MPFIRSESLTTHKLRANHLGEVLTDRLVDGRYGTDASECALLQRAIAVPLASPTPEYPVEHRRSKFQLTMRGGGTSRNGQAINERVAMNTARHLNRLLEVDAEAAGCEVEPGIVLDELHPQIAHNGCGLLTTSRPRRAQR